LHGIGGRAFGSVRLSNQQKGDYENQTVLHGNHFGCQLVSGSACVWAGRPGRHHWVITDSTGAVVPGVEVTALHLETKAAFKATTTSGGIYRIPYVPAGTYRVSSDVKGFKTSVLDQVTAAVATVVTVDLKLEVGSASESITVTSAASQLESSSSELGYTVSTQDFTTGRSTATTMGSARFRHSSTTACLEQRAILTSGASTDLQQVPMKYISRVFPSAAQTLPETAMNSSRAWTRSANSGFRPADSMPLTAAG
jgi:hypothetical protein